MRDLQRRPVSIKDIARLAQVSHSTVSRALRDSTLVNEETAQRIKQIAREAGYQASAVARSLVTQETRTIGVVVTTITDPFVSEVVSGIEETANLLGYSILLAESNADPEREKRVVQSCAERRLDAIVVTSSRVGALYVPLLSEMRVPILLVNNQNAGEFVHSVMIANRTGAKDVVSHLLDLGHTRIGYIGDRYGHQSDKERYAGYRDAFKAAGVKPDAGLVVHGDGKAEGGESAMNDLLSLPQPPTAVFCYNDVTAVGALRATYARGLRVPADISVAGFDDIPFARYLFPPLTTVRQPMREMGRLAMQSLIRLLSGHGSEETIQVPAELVIRESTAPPHGAARAQTTVASE